MKIKKLRLMCGFIKDYIIIQNKCKSGNIGVAYLEMIRENKLRWFGCYVYR